MLAEVGFRCSKISRPSVRFELVRLEYKHSLADFVSSWRSSCLFAREKGHMKFPEHSFHDHLVN
jgi:hypothetical protein